MNCKMKMVLMAVTHVKAISTRTEHPERWKRVGTSLSLMVKETLICKKQEKMKRLTLTRFTSILTKSKTSMDLVRNREKIHQSRTL
jgi:hypothetical protein